MVGALKDDAIISIQTPSKVGSNENLAAEADNNHDVEIKPKLE